MASPESQPVRLLIGLVGIALLGCPRNPGPTQFHGETMGTTYAVKLSRSLTPHEARSLKTAVDDVLARIVSRMSTYDPASELSRFNARRSTGWFPASAELVHVVQAAIEVSRRTQGAFDVTVGPLVDLYGFGSRGPEIALPAAQALEAARRRVGFEKLSCREEPPALRKADPGVTIDLSGIAKGYAVDEVAAVVEGRGLRDYLVEIGGEVRTKGVNPDGKSWRVGVERAQPGRRQIDHVVSAPGRGVATSGDYRNFFEREGRRYSHIIDPRTGQPVLHELASVCVIAENTMIADAFATALLVLGLEEGRRLAREQDLAALLTFRTDHGFASEATPRFERYRVGEGR